MNTPSPQPVRCGNPACKVAETGKCIEGLDPSSCANYGKEPRSTEESIGDTNAPVEIRTIQFSSASHLSTDEATQLLGRFPTQVIAILGPHDAGKTSLIARVYEMFQRGPISGYAFAGSRTLHAFEWVCHDSRSASERDTPDTERTKRGDVSFYHLDVGHPASDTITTLLLADRAGEEYREAADNISRARELDELRRANVLTLLVDGERLSNLRTRHSVVQQVSNTLLAIHQAGVLSSHQHLVFVLTKLDLVQKSVHHDQAIADFAKLHYDLEKKYKTTVSQIAKFEVAALPKSPTVAAGYGVAGLFEYWLQAPSPVVCSLQEVRVPDRAIDRYIYREDKQ
jgi:hypothetical protein